MSLTQITKEFKYLDINPIGNIGATVRLPNPNNMFEWICTLMGPKDSLYKGGLFFLTILFPDNYPNKRPEVFFKTPIYHLNVNPNRPNLGHINISTLNFWKPEYNIKQVLCDVFKLLYKANPECAYGSERANEFRFNRELYEEKVKYFTKKYANFEVADKEYNESWNFSYYDKLIEIG